jgi:hypothetical protein
MNAVNHEKEPLYQMNAVNHEKDVDQEECRIERVL